MKLRSKKEMSEFGTRLYKVMKSQRYNQTELAEDCGLARLTIYSVLYGEREPSVNTLTALCKTLGVSADYLLGLTDEVSK